MLHTCLNGASPCAAGYSDAGCISWPRRHAPTCYVPCSEWPTHTQPAPQCTAGYSDDGCAAGCEATPTCTHFVFLPLPGR